MINNFEMNFKPNLIFVIFTWNFTKLHFLWYLYSALYLHMKPSVAVLLSYVVFSFLEKMQNSKSNRHFCLFKVFFFIIETSEKKIHKIQLYNDN